MLPRESVMLDRDVLHSSEGQWSRNDEFFIDDQVLNFRRLIATQLKHKGGYLSLPKTPGLGCDFDEKAVKRYALTPARPWAGMR